MTERESINKMVSEQDLKKELGLSKKTAENMLEKLSDKVNNKLDIELDDISYSYDVSTAAIDMGTGETFINPNFLSRVSKNMSTPHALEALLDHEFGHWAFHPYNDITVILEHAALLNKPNADLVRNFYDDVNDNLRIICDPDCRSDINEVYKSLNPESDTEKVILKLYQDVLRKKGIKKDFGIKDSDLSDELRKLSQDLQQINYLNDNNPKKRIEYQKKDPKQNMKDVKKFYDILSKTIEQDQKNNKSFKSQTKQSRMHDIPFDDVKKAIGEGVVKGYISPEDGKDLIKDYILKTYQGKGPHGIRGTEVFASKHMYEAIAAAYSILITSPPIESEGIFPEGNEDYSIGDSLEDYDPFNSYGVIIPGISKKTVKTGSKFHGDAREIPNLQILLDVSGSMDDPVYYVSNAVLGAYIISREYLSKGAEVGVIRFSSDTKTFDFSYDADKVLENLMGFEGGSTKIDIDKVKKHSQQCNTNHDMVVISDGEISEGEKLIQYMNKMIHKGHRSYFINIGYSSRHEKDKGKVKFYNIRSSDDLAKIVLDDMHSS